MSVDSWPLKQASKDKKSAKAQAIYLDGPKGKVNKNIK